MRHRQALVYALVRGQIQRHRRGERLLAAPITTTCGPRSKRFSDCFYDTTLPAEVVEAVAANLSILKSPTVLRQADGRLWGWEGCRDDFGCCYGSCTHVWNYAQSICHLFPDLERTLRETEFDVTQDDSGHQAFRMPMPIRPPRHDFHSAADGQLGGIMKVYRDWRISGDDAWLRRLWPRVRAAWTTASRPGTRRTRASRRAASQHLRHRVLGPRRHVHQHLPGGAVGGRAHGTRICGEDVSRGTQSCSKRV